MEEVRRKTGELFVVLVGSLKLVVVIVIEAGGGFDFRFLFLS